MNRSEELASLALRFSLIGPGESDRLRTMTQRVYQLGLEALQNADPCLVRDVLAALRDMVEHILMLRNDGSL